MATGLENMDGAEQAVKGLAVLAAIPVVLFTLWADYFGRYVDQATSTKGRQAAAASDFKFDPKLELDRVKMAGVCVLLFEIVLFAGSIDVASLYPKFSVAAFFVATISLGVVQALLEKKIKATLPESLAPAKNAVRNSQSGIGSNTNSGSEFHSVLDSSVQSNSNQTQTNNNANQANPLRALIFAAVGGFSYVFTLVITVQIAAWIAVALQLSNLSGGFLVVGSAAVGIFLGLALNFGLTPWQLKNSLPVSRVPDGEVRDLLTEAFKKIRPSTAQSVSQNPTTTGFEFFQINVSGPRTATAIVAGFAGGKGIFQPAFFISKTLIDQLSPSEIHAVVTHEAAHIKRSHLRKRVLLSGCLIVGLTIACVFTITALHVLFPGSEPLVTVAAGLENWSTSWPSEWNETVEFVLALVAVVGTFRVLARQSRKHETEADWLSVSEFKVPFDDWANALRKIDSINCVTEKTQNTFQMFFGRGHLPTEKRIKVIHILLSKYGHLTHKSGDKPGDKSGGNSDENTRHDLDKAA